MSNHFRTGEMSSIFSTVKAIFQAYVMPPALNPEQLAQAKSRAEAFISQNRIAIFSKSYCPYCTSAKRLLDSLGARFEVIELDKDPEGPALQSSLAQMQSRGSVTVPQIYISNELIGGCDDLQAAQRNGTLGAKLQSAKA